MGNAFQDGIYDLAVSRDKVMAWWELMISKYVDLILLAGIVTNDWTQNIG
jgi:hypothetical protein